MDSSGLYGTVENARASIGRMLGSGDGYDAFLRRRRIKQWIAAVAGVVVLVLIGVAAHSIGSSGVGDADAYSKAGKLAGEATGSALGASEGYERSYEQARDDAYDQAYREAYVSAYRDAFAKADLDAPQTVKVSGP